jgi:YD repeat-containing protein
MKRKTLLELSGPSFLSHDPEEHQRLVAEGLQFAVEQTNLKWWRPGDEIMSNGVRLLVGIAPWVPDEIKILARIAEQLDKFDDRIYVDVFSLAETRTAQDLDRYLPGAGRAPQSPVLGRWQGLTFTYSYDAMGRPEKLTDNQPTPVDWVTNAVYGAAGQMTAMTQYHAAGYLGPTQYTFNANLQLTEVRRNGVTLQTYTYSPTANNGRVTDLTGITETGGGITWWGVSYTYDSLNRLSTAVSGSTWGLSFTYDGFGNRTAQTVTLGSGPSSSLSVNAANNRVTSWTYDARERDLGAAGGRVRAELQLRLRESAGVGELGDAGVVCIRPGQSAHLEEAAGRERVSVLVRSGGQARGDVSDLHELDDFLALGAGWRRLVFRGSAGCWRIHAAGSCGFVGAVLSLRGGADSVVVE